MGFSQLLVINLCDLIGSVDLSFQLDQLPLLVLIRHLLLLDILLNLLDFLPHKTSMVFVPLNLLSQLVDFLVLVLNVCTSITDLMLKLLTIE